MLGTGTPNADPDRYGPSVAIVVDDAELPRGFRRRRRAPRRGSRALGHQGAERRQPEARAFATHLHSDHTLGLADLILTPWILERDDAARPSTARAGCARWRTIWSRRTTATSTSARRGGEPAHKHDPRIVNVHEITAPGIVYRDDSVTVTAFAVKHGAWPQAFGYRFQTPDRTIVISGDTGPDSRIEDQCRRCDVLVHEVYSEAGFAKRPPEWQAYHSRYHTSTRELGAIASRARPGLLVLYHQLIWSSTEEELLKEVRSAYDGKVVSAHDLDVY